MKNLSIHINNKKTIIFNCSFILLSIILLIITYFYTFRINFSKSNTRLRNRATYSLYIHTDDTFENIINKLSEDSVLINNESFIKYALKQQYDKSIKPGRFLISEGMNNYQLLKILLRGEQTPVKVIFNSIKNVEVLAGIVSKQIEADSASIVNSFYDISFINSLGYTPEDAYIMMIPNTYEFYWNTSAKNFWKRMKNESNKFWNESRKSQAQQINLTLKDVVTLASIVECETQKNSEKATIAGVYMNRLHKGIHLQADPTLVYIANYNGLRVKNIFKKIDSPYNTYMYKGLPPGPIWIPSIKSIDAVLNYERHNYLFFCAKPDLSGYHNFSETYFQHRNNARNFQKTLNEKNIK